MKVYSKVFRSHFYIWPGVSAFVTAGMNTPFHAHNTIQVAIDLENTFKIESESGIARTCNCAIIKHDVIHRLNSLGSHQIILYIDKASFAGKKLIGKHLKEQEVTFPEFKISQHDLSEVLGSAIIRQDNKALFEQVQIILKELLGEHKKSEPGDERIIKVQSIIDAALPSELKINILADQVHLSASRMRHLFKDQAGLSIGQYILWRKIIYSIHLILTGRTLSDAAFESGFSDLSHYHKVMIKMFGIPPSYIIKANRTPDQKVSGTDIFKIRTEIVDSGKFIEYKF